MTAPDPGLTDLIAAHEESGQGRWLAHDGVYMRCRCGETMHPIHWPAHVALVVEQHTNGRIAELYEQRDSAIEAGLAAIDRAEKAEATIARVQYALKGVCDSCDYTDLRAALEGEQQ